MVHEKGIITNIQHYCYQDGPGVRTTVFLKGCSLNCKWCSNPENISQGIEYRENNNVLGDLNLCGKEVTSQQVMEEVMLDYIFYANSGGGITVSGGEPLLQPDFVADLFRIAHENGITTAVETAGNVPWEVIEKVFPLTDTILHDIKLMDSERHRKWTGVDNSRILKNFSRAYEAFPDKNFIARTPVIKGINDDEENIKRTLEFIAPYENVTQYELLEYHRLGMGKYQELGKTYELTDAEAPSAEQIQYLNSLIAEFFNKRKCA